MILTPMKTSSLFDKFGAVFAVLGATSTPCCFPLFASVGAAPGRSSAFGRFALQISPVVQLCVGLSLAGSVAAFGRHRVICPLLQPKRGDCGVFCSNGSAPCQPIQLGRECCA